MKESVTYTLFGDLDGLTVEELIELFEEYPKDAVLDVRTEKVYGYGGWTENDREYFVFCMKEDNDA